MKQGNLVLLEVIKVDGRKTNMGRYQCDCGQVTSINRYNVNAGKQISCGCALKASRTSHGMCGTTTYQRWEDMKSRCRPTSKRADRYFDRGIGYTPEWEKFEGFYADMGDCPEGLELDRIDNDKGYSKENCRWVDRSMNMRNRTDTNKRGVGKIQNTHYVKARGRWMASVSHEGKRKHLGMYGTELEAGKAYNAFAKIHGYPERELYG